MTPYFHIKKNLFPAETFLFCPLEKGKQIINISFAETPPNPSGNTELYKLCGLHMVVQRNLSVPRIITCPIWKFQLLPLKAGLLNCCSHKKSIAIKGASLFKNQLEEIILDTLKFL